MKIVEPIEYRFVEGILEQVQLAVQEAAADGWRLRTMTPVRLGPGGLYEYCAAMERCA